jgi:arylsulfatase A-like enzyme
MIVAGPGVAGAGAIHHAYVGVPDLAPTLLEVAGATYPADLDASGVRPMTGTSMLPLLAGEADRVHPPTELLALSHGMHAYVRMGDWKLVSSDQYRGEGTFQLFELSSDPGETTDLSERFPERRAELLDSLAAFRARVDVVLPGG